MGSAVRWSNRIEASQNHYHPPAPDVLVARFGSLVIGLDGRGLHIARINPQTTRSGR
jgi:hypothetical protein